MAIESSNLVHRAIKYGLRVAYQYCESELREERNNVYCEMQLSALSSTYPLCDFTVCLQENILQRRQ